MILAWGCGPGELWILRVYVVVWFLFLPYCVELYFFVKGALLEVERPDESAWKPLFTSVVVVRNDIRKPGSG